nr:unnamed protein product [Callosobruchus analis]
MTVRGRSGARGGTAESRIDWDKIDSTTFRINVENEREKHTNTQKKKVEKLASTKKSTPRLDTKRTVVNISKRNLSEDEISILAKGGSFAITPKQIPTEDIIANLDSAKRFLPEDKAQEIRT